ncbi:AraC family transcriptional regulator [Falsochrobactrum ovis]|uniref:AraC family transcriptional regulator n=1 Tax=Falsochrobactrum ovis TaxID=1293442 RepID=UPI000DB908C9|nr:AraC family transcriptional regulator [Falsochrobactrum ovis]
MAISSDNSSSLPNAYAATREKITIPGGKSYLIRRDDYPNPICIWNYHPEWEIHYIPHAQGLAYVGDYVGAFQPGHLVLTGTNLPHNWITPGVTYIPGRDYVLQFDADALIKIRSTCPEFDVLHRLKQLSRRGIEIIGQEASEIGVKIEELHRCHDVSGLGLFLEILEGIDQAPHKRLLASEHFASHYSQLTDKRHRRIDQAIQILQSNPGSQMQQVAEAVGLTPAAFTRAFKRLTGMSFSTYSRSVRVWRARTLLVETDMAITDICFEAGFNNLSNFNRYFLQETGLNPRAYRNAAHIRDSSIAPLRTVV